MPVGQIVQPLRRPPFPQPAVAQVVQFDEVIEDLAQHRVVELTRRDAAQVGQPDAASRTLLEQAEYLLHQDGGAKRGSGGLETGGKRGIAGKLQQRGEAHIFQRAARQAQHPGDAGAPAAATDALQEGSQRRRRSDQRDIVDAADVDAQLQRRAGDADGDAGLGEAVLHLPPPGRVHVGVVDEQRRLERQPAAQIGRDLLHLVAGVAEDQGLVDSQPIARPLCQRDDEVVEAV